jgi:PAS domain S-box-containing protein
VEPLRLASGEIAGITCVAVDISARKQAEEALRASEERYRTVVEDQTEVVSRFKADGTFTFVNEVFCRFFGKTREELLGRRWQPNAVAEDLLMIEAKLRTLSPAHPVVVIENRAYAADGGVHWMQFVNRAFFDATGLLIEMQSVGRDITERKRLEADRAAALARLAFVEEQERLRLSRELHDQTAQRLVALAVELKNLETDLTAGDTRAGKVRSLRRAVDDLQQQVRQIAWDLRAGELMEGGFERALREYVEEWSERAGVTVDCECQGLNDQQSPPLLEATLYRVAQEALANVQKHARARRVSVLLERVDALLRLTVEDDGCGFDLEKVENLPATERRLGLLGMKERVRLAGGSLVLETSPGAGTTVLVRLPIVAGAEL